MVIFLMRHLNIIIHAEDLTSRCVKCNRRDFMQIPRHIVKLLFYNKAVLNKYEWLAITADDVQDALHELKDYAVKKDSAGVPIGGELGEEEYMLNITNEEMIAQCRSFTIDLMTGELSISANGDPMPVDVPLNLNKEYLNSASDRHFYICGHCGKMQPNVLNAVSQAE